VVVVTVLIELVLFQVEQQTIHNMYTLLFNSTYLKELRPIVYND